MGAGQWLSVRSVFSAPRALGSGLLAGLAARRRRFLRARRRGTFGTTVPAADVAARRIAPTAKRRVGRGRPRTVGRIQRQTLAQLHRHGVKTASQLDKLRRFQRLEYGAVHSGQVKLVFGSHVPSESQTPSLGKPPRQSLENHRRVNRLYPPRRGVNGYDPLVALLRPLTNALIPRSVCSDRRAACCTEEEEAKEAPIPTVDHATRTEFGRSSIRLRAWAAMATSVARASSLWKRSPSPMTCFQRANWPSTQALSL